LAALGSSGRMTSKAVGSHSSMHKTKVSRAVADLESRRWLSRNPNPADRREEILSLTTLGRNTYGDIIPRAVAFERMILERLGADAEAFLSGLGSLEAELAGGRNDVET
ncbi:MAG TPA: MarR family winged helix-turn-helix transcriptional regulator, partial [Shinella sp.]|nr:MarR family winged helix-turn-helix transcriptional regulator [Shinella sp.]